MGIAPVRVSRQASTTVALAKLRFIVRRFLASAMLDWRYSQ